MRDMYITVRLVLRSLPHNGIQDIVLADLGSGTVVFIWRSCVQKALKSSVERWVNARALTQTDQETLKSSRVFEVRRWKYLGRSVFAWWKSGCSHDAAVLKEGEPVHRLCSSLAICV